MNKKQSWMSYLSNCSGFFLLEAEVPPSGDTSIFSNIILHSSHTEKISHIKKSKKEIRFARGQQQHENWVLFMNKLRPSLRQTLLDVYSQFFWSVNLFLMRLASIKGPRCYLIIRYSSSMLELALTLVSVQGRVSVH